MAGWEDDPSQQALQINCGSVKDPLTESLPQVSVMHLLQISFPSPEC